MSVKSLWSKMVYWFCGDTKVKERVEPVPEFPNHIPTIPIVDNSKMIFTSPFEDLYRDNTRNPFANVDSGITILDEDDEEVEIDMSPVVPLVPEE